MSTPLAITPSTTIRGARAADRRPLRALAATLALAGAAPALAQIVYFDPPDIDLPTDRSALLDLNADGAADFTLLAFPDGSLHGAGYAVGWSASPLLIADRLDPGSIIDIEAGWITSFCDDHGCTYPLLYSPSAPASQWSPGQPGLLGVAFPDRGGLIHFAWLQVAPALEAQPARILDWAFESSPFTAIPAGDPGFPCPPQILTPPASASALVGDAIQLSVVAQGRDLAYQWAFNGSPLTDGPGIQGSREPTLRLSDVRRGHAGSYAVLVTSPCGDAAPPDVKLDVLPDCPPFEGMAFFNNGDPGFVYIPDAPALDLQRTATFEAWFRPAPGAPPARLLSKGDGLDADTDRAVDLTWFPGRDPDPGFIVAEFFLGPAHAARNRIGLVSSLLVTPGAWNHVAATLDTDAGLCRLYINGAPAGETSVLEDGLTPIPPIDLRNSSYPLVIGAIPPFGYFNGRIDEVRVWSVARTPDEIAASFNTPVDPASPGLVACYRFDDGPADSAGANHGALAGSAALVFTHPCCPADFNRDDFVDFFDYLEFAACFDGDRCPDGADADFNHDGFLDFFDYLDFVSAFEIGCR